MSQQQRTQPWRAFWKPEDLPEKAGDEYPEIAFEKGKTVIISDSGGGGFTPKTYTQLYKAHAAPNTIKVNQDVHIEKDTSGKCFAKFESSGRTEIAPHLAFSQISPRYCGDLDR